MVAVSWVGRIGMISVLKRGRTNAPPKETIKSHLLRLVIQHAVRAAPPAWRCWPRCATRVSRLAAVRLPGRGSEIVVSQRLTVVVADDETTALVFLYVPRWRKAARRGQPRSTVTTPRELGIAWVYQTQAVAMRSVREGPPRFWRPTRRLVQSRLAYPDQVQQEPSARLRPFAVRSASSDWPLVNSPDLKSRRPPRLAHFSGRDHANKKKSSKPPQKGENRWFVGRAQSLRWSKVAGSGARRA